MSIKAAANEILVNPAATQATGMTTAATGAAWVLDLIPDDIGKVAVLVGLVLSSLMIWKNLIEIKILRRSLKDK